jgi:hypothetical protein
VKALAGRLLGEPVLPRGGRENAAASLAVFATWLGAWIPAVHAIYNGWNVAGLCVAVLLLVVAVGNGAAHGTPSRAVLLVAVASTPLPLLISPPNRHNLDAGVGGLVPSMVLAAAAALAVAAVVLPSRIAPKHGAAGVLAISAAAFGTMITGSRPLIDVWVILQDSARGLLDGRNPYTMSFPGVPAGQMDWCFNYWPVTFLSTAPGRWAFGDVRWAEALYLLAVPVLLVWHVGQRSGWRDRRGIALAVLTAVVPGALLIVQQAWTEPMLLLGMVAGAVLLARDRANWAVLPLGLALATKQHLAVLLPLLLFWPRFGWKRLLATGGVAAAVSLPWLLADPARFRLCSVDFFLDQPEPPKSLSVWQVLPEPARMPLLLLGFAAAVVLLLRRVPRTPGGFLIASGVLLSVFSLLNKQTFLNQWWLAAAFVVAGYALGRARPDDRAEADVGSER